MSEINSNNNFIHNFIDEDLEKGVYDHVYTRFPPEPNGYLHLGHVKAMSIDFTTAEKYGGKCNLRYDDTNPVKEDVEFVEAQQRDIKWLGFTWDKLIWASEYFDTMYDAAVELIKKGKAYVDDLTQEQMKEYRGTLTEPGKESPWRNRSVEENLQLFADMKAGKYADGEKVLRAKIDMASPNINMRDPVIYRVAHMAHHRTGDKWCIYPMYDFAHPIEDAIEGITHSICTLEFEDHRPLYDWVLEEVGFWPNPPRQIEFAPLNVTTMLMSKRFIKKLVDDGNVSGWDDPRLCTLAGVRRRGYTPEAIRKFCNDIGVTKADTMIDIAQLEQCVREDLQLKVPAINVVKNPIKVIIDNYPEDKIEMCTVENNGKVPEMGNREIPFGRELWVDGDDFMEIPAKKYFRLFPGNEVRFKGAYFITCNEVEKDADGNIVALHCTYDPETHSGSGFEGRKVKGTIHFVEASTAVKIKIREYGYLMRENEETGEQEFDPDSLVETWGYAEPSVADVKAGERFQFFRKGYYIADSELTTDDEKVFNSIVGLKSSWKPQ